MPMTYTYKVKSKATGSYDFIRVWADDEPSAYNAAFLAYNFTHIFLSITGTPSPTRSYGINATK